MLKLISFWVITSINVEAQVALLVWPWGRHFFSLVVRINHVPV